MSYAPTDTDYWADETHGQDPYDLADDDLTTDEYGEPLECLDDHSGTPCVGPVTYRPSPGGGSFPRCEAHNEARWDRYESADSVERYADSDGAPPEWFDEGYAGERWSDDY